MRPGRRRSPRCDAGSGGVARSGARPARRRSPTTSKSKRRCSTDSGVCSSSSGSWAAALLPVVDTAHRVVGSDRLPLQRAGVDARRSVAADRASAADLRRARYSPAARARRPLPWHATREVIQSGRDLLLRLSRRAGRRWPSLPLQLVRGCALRRGHRAPPDANAREAADYNRGMPVRLGLERLLDGPDRKLIAGQRIGLVCNPASIDSRHRPRRRIASAPATGRWRRSSARSTASAPTCRKT